MMQTRNATIRSWAIPVLVYALVVAMQCATWFALYRFVGYSDLTITIATTSYLILGLLLIAALQLGWQQVGLGARALLQAVLVVAAAYLLLLCIGWLLNQIGGQIRLFRDSYSLSTLLHNWVLTGLGEEIVFAGVLFTLLREQPVGRKSWLAVLLVALLFALWHLPGYLAIAFRTGNWNASFIFDLLLNVVSWVFFGTIYLLSRNLWLTAMAHASTDYALLPMITSNPALGLVFMLVLVGGAYTLQCQHTK